ncbi:hypothetical protein GNQ08_30870 [Paenibacillus macerans]|uniref:Uncharacterized protein n=1 Tax=Paenibacillus macerans TaxID=44252 RepID=A0A6N8F795_PAEMA|nr:hypothetical protein [Paenibacillus macerans]
MNQIRQEIKTKIKTGDQGPIKLICIKLPHRFQRLDQAAAARGWFGWRAISRR